MSLSMYAFLSYFSEKTYLKHEDRQLVIWENLMADEFLREIEAGEQNNLDNKVKVTNDRFAQSKHVFITNFSYFPSF